MTTTAITIDTTGTVYPSSEAAAAQLNPGTYSATYLNGDTGATWIGDLVVVSPTFAHFAPIPPRMTAHGAEALRIVGNAYTEAGILVARPITTSLTGFALDVLGETYGKPLDRDSAIDAIVYRWDLERPLATKLLDLAVEALAANPDTAQE